jgi:hypothetical protein
MKPYLKLIVMLGAFLALFSFAQAQDTAPILDLGQVGTVYGVPVAALLSLLGTVIVALVKVAAPKIPTKALPFIAPVATVALDYISHLSFGTDSNVWLALGAGVASIGLYELKKRVTT